MQNLQEEIVQNLREEIDGNYNRGLLLDQIKNNEKIIKLLDEYFERKEEQDRIKRLKIMNNLSPKSKRKMLSKSPNISDDGDSEFINFDPNKFYDPLFTLTLNIDDYTFIYDLKTLYEEKRIHFNDQQKIEYIQVPVLVDNVEESYTISDKLTNQWDFDFIEQVIKKLEESNPSDNTRFEKPFYEEEVFEEEVFEELDFIKKNIQTKLYSLGFDKENVDNYINNYEELDDLIDNYEKSDFSKDRIIEKMVETFLNNFI